VISIRSKHLAVIVPVVFAAGIGLTMAFNLWKTETDKVPAAYTSGEFAGQANPADIRGSYTFADIAKAFPVPVDVLARAFGVTENPAAFQVKSLEGTGSLDTDSVRLFVARYAGLPYEPAATTVLPAEAAAVLNAKGGLSAEQTADLRARVAGGGSGEPATAAAQPSTPAAATTAAPAAGPAAAATPAPVVSTEHATAVEDRAVKGSTTFKALLDWGVSEADIRKVFGGDMGATGVALKDYCTQKGIEFSTVKTALQDLVNAAAP
jgi:hypothetical protein